MDANELLGVYAEYRGGSILFNNTAYPYVNAVVDYFTLANPDGTSLKFTCNFSVTILDNVSIKNPVKAVEFEVSTENMDELDFEIVANLIKTNVPSIEINGNTCIQLGEVIMYLR